MKKRKTEMNTTNETPINSPRVGCAFCARLQDINTMLIRDGERFCDLCCATSFELMRYAQANEIDSIGEASAFTYTRSGNPLERLTEPNVSATAGHTAIAPAKESIDGKGSVAG